MSRPDNASALLSSLIGPTASVNEVCALGGVYAQYEADFVTYANSHWASEGSNWASANYYDRAWIYYTWWQRTGDQMYLDRANALAVDYRDNYLATNNYSPSAYWSQLGGVTLHYLVTGDEADRTAIGHVADLFAMPYYTSNLGNLNADGMDNRTQARVLEAFLYAWEINAPSIGMSGAGIPGGNDWAARLRSALNDILASQSPDGAYRCMNTEGYAKPFMVGILNEVLIQYYENFEADPRILTAVQRSLDYIWNHCWDENADAFRYLEGDTVREPTSDGLGTTPAPDLNNLIVSGFGWLYHMTGDETYRTRGDQVFAGGVSGTWLNGSKQFNEEYRSSYRYLSYILGAGEHHSPVEIGNTVWGSNDNEILFGSQAADTIIAGMGNNTIVGGHDSSDKGDSITSQNDNDLIFGNGGADTIDSGANADTVVGGFGADSILAAGGNNLVYGNQGDDVIVSAEGADFVIGGLNNDTISTGAANDTIFGNEGNDLLIGGSGADRYVFIVGSGSDEINGFNFAEGDRLNLQGQTFALGTSRDGDALLLLSGAGTIELNGILPRDLPLGITA